MTQTNNRQTKTFVIFIDRTRFVQIYSKKRFTIFFEISRIFRIKTSFYETNLTIEKMN